MAQRHCCRVRSQIHKPLAQSDQSGLILKHKSGSCRYHFYDYADSVLFLTFAKPSLPKNADGTKYQPKRGKSTGRLPIAKHFYQLWLDNEVPADSIQSNWLEITLQFIEYARRELHYKAFVAEVNGTVVGSVSCQLCWSLPACHRRAVPKIWIHLGCSMLNRPTEDRGLPKPRMALDHLKLLNCTGDPTRLHWENQSTPASASGRAMRCGWI